MYWKLGLDWLGSFRVDAFDWIELIQIDFRPISSNQIQNVFRISSKWLGMVWKQILEWLGLNPNSIFSPGWFMQRFLSKCFNCYMSRIVWFYGWSVSPHFAFVVQILKPQTPSLLRISVIRTSITEVFTSTKPPENVQLCWILSR